MVLFFFDDVNTVYIQQIYKMKLAQKNRKRNKKG